MIGITISSKAYAAIAATLPASSPREGEIASDGEYRLWLPRTVVERLMARREPGDTFSDVILRLMDRGAFAAIMREALARDGAAGG
jgi:hypothetical protein